MDLHHSGARSESPVDETYRPRRVERVTVRAAGQLRQAGGEPVEIMVCDLSTAGFMAECLRPVLIGSFISLDLPGIGPVNAQVRWQVGGRMGGKFLDAVSIHRCDWLTPPA